MRWKESLCWYGKGDQCDWLYVKKINAFAPLHMVVTEEQAGDL